MRTRGLDPAPLLALVPGSGADQALALGVTRRTIVRWRNGHAGPPKTDAYRLAHAVGRHPSEIWPAMTPRHLPTQPTA